MSDDLDDIVDNLRETSAWIRVLFMVGFALVLYLVIAPIVVVMLVVQALFAILTGASNTNLRRFGNALSQYVLQILQFLTYNSEYKPFPFNDFPSLGAEDDKDMDDEDDAAADQTGNPASASGGGAAAQPTASQSPGSESSATGQPKPDAGSISEPVSQVDNGEAGDNDKPAQ